MRHSSLTTGIFIATIAFIALCTSFGALNPFNLVDPLGATLMFVFIAVVFGWMYYPVALVAVALLWYIRNQFVKSLSSRMVFILSAGIIGHGLFWCLHGLFWCLGIQYIEKSDFWDGNTIKWFMTESGVISALIIDLIHLFQEKQQEKIAEGHIQPTAPKRNR